MSLRDQVIQAARVLFMQRGYEAVGMREIAAAVGKQPVQVYRLKLSKADILAEVIIELNVEQIQQLPEICSGLTGTTLNDRVCGYLEQLYRVDVDHLPIRSVGAAFGWMWSLDYERRIVAQVIELLKPVTGWMAEDGFDDIPARCMGVWSLYYVGYRHAVIHGGSAEDCLAAIRPSLRYYLEKPLGR